MDRTPLVPLRGGPFQERFARTREPAALFQEPRRVPDRARGSVPGAPKGAFQKPFGLFQIEPEALFHEPFGQFHLRFARSKGFQMPQGGVLCALTRVPRSFEKIMINCG